MKKITHYKKKLLQGPFSWIHNNNITLFVCLMVFNATFKNISVTRYIMAVSFIGGGNRRTRCHMVFWTPWMKIEPGVNLPWGSKYHMTGVYIQNVYFNCYYVICFFFSCSGNANLTFEKGSMFFLSFLSTKFIEKNNTLSRKMQKEIIWPAVFND